MKQPQWQRLPEEVGRLRQAYESSQAQPVSSEHIEKLERAGNCSPDWSTVRISSGFTPESVYGCELERCTLGQGIILRNSRIIDSMILDNAIIRNCSLIAGHIIGAHACVEDSRLEHAGTTMFGNDVDVSLGSELHLSETPLYAELDGEYVCTALAGCTTTALPDDVIHGIRGYRSAVSSHVAMVGEEAHISGAGLIRSSFIGAGVVVEASTLIEESTLLAPPAEASADTGKTFAGAAVILQQALVQGGAVVTSGAQVVRTLLGPNTRISDSATIRESLICRRSEIGRGEISYSLIGPLVNMHHESLVIATLWPHGRGNVGSGAQIGSNHTSRLPDQSLLAGEGMFFGLSTAIKFPANYYESPYSVIATGLITAPQRVCFPFSLISILDDVPEDAPSGYNRLIPGWMFSHNLFALLRDERKFAQRLGVHIRDTSVIRDETVTAVRHALSRLTAVETPAEWYDEGRIPGVGKNVLLEADRKRGIGAYRDLLEYYALREVVWNEGIIRDGERRDVFLDLLERLKIRARDSRARDFHRGSRIFDDYDQVHPHPEDDEELLAVLATLEHEQALLTQNA